MVRFADSLYSRTCPPPKRLRCVRGNADPEHFDDPVLGRDLLGHRPVFVLDRGGGLTREPIGERFGLGCDQRDLDSIEREVASARRVQPLGWERSPGVAKPFERRLIPPIEHVVDGQSQAPALGLEKGRMSRNISEKGSR
jgi:hypothetical protein